MRQNLIKCAYTKVSIIKLFDLFFKNCYIYIVLWGYYVKETDQKTKETVE